MNTTSAGNPNEPEQPAGSIPWLALLFGLAALIFVVLTGPRLIGILFAIMAPPEPPVPGDARLLRYSSQGYGVDTWYYDTQSDVCSITDFYIDQGGICPVMPPSCAPDSRTSQSADYIAVCYSDMDFSIFAVRWRFAVPLRTVPGPRLRFETSREIFWTGDPPPFQP